MTTTPHLFAAYLKCPTKCWLRWAGEQPTGNAYAEWVVTQNESYRDQGAKRLMADVPVGERATTPPATHLKTAKWRLAIDVPVQASEFETRIHGVERVPSVGRGSAAQLVPIRFVFLNKLSRQDKLLLAFEALALSESLGRDISAGKIIHGDDHATMKVKISALAGEVRRQVAKIAALVASASPPDLVLNRHCAECEFQARCRKIAVEKDDLSLLARMSEKERRKLRSKGIFTITQLSYTFRPRRRSKRLRDKREKYHHSLKALAIREKKIHIVGSPELKIEGTPVFLDVEGLPDRDFYYLIGVRIGDGESTVQRSLWADAVEDEEKIWREFLSILNTVEKPVLIHYGKYETVFLRRMVERYGALPGGSIAAKVVDCPVNILSAIFARVYFPVFSNGLKEVASWLNFTWPETSKGGLETIARREHWAERPTAEAKQQLTRYNACDCEALKLVTETLLDLQRPKPGAVVATGSEVVDITLMKREHPYGFKLNNWVLPELEAINKAAYWDYQRERVYVRSNRRIRHVLLRKRHRAKTIQPNRIAQCPRPQRCPKCDSARVEKHRKLRKLVYNLKFTSGGVKRWVVRYDSHRYRCLNCDHTFNPPERDWPRSRFGSDLIAYSIYQMIELRVPTETVNTSLNRIFGLQLPINTVQGFKIVAAEDYAGTFEAILTKLKTGSLIHADETKVNVGGSDAFVWVFTSMEEVAYVFAATREATRMQALLKEFKGVLVSDFFAAYEALECPQQKCLIHLIRDINDALHKHPFDEDMKRIAQKFTCLLRPIVETVDRFGLRSHFLRRHSAPVARFYKKLLADELRSEVAVKFRTRFEKHRCNLFTFLEHDGVPWNNNNAEHAIKPLAKLRHVFNGLTTEKGIQRYLVLLSVCQTCKYMGVDFLDFLRSGEKDIHTYAQRHRKRRPEGADNRKTTSPFSPLLRPDRVKEVNDQDLSESAIDGDASDEGGCDQKGNSCGQ